ncbi:MAG: cytochrome P450 [Marinobacterium sp.]
MFNGPIVAELVGLPNTSPAQMLKWASATFNLFGDDNPRTRASMEVLKDLKKFLDENGTPDKLVKGGWAHRIFEVGEARGISRDECAQLMRDYINPSLDSTISATGQLIKLFADNPDQWQLIRKDPSLIDNAIEEGVRLASPLRALTRYAIKDYEIGGTVIPEGSRVLVMYASANRDERKYTNPDDFDITRDVHDHVGFGHGIHMCMGMHLARLEIRSLLQSMRKRIKQFHLTAEPTVAMNNSIRAWATLPVKVDVEPLKEVQEATVVDVDERWIDARIISRKPVADAIVELVFEVNDLTRYEQPEPGSHIDIELPSGLIRQYSLHTTQCSPGTCAVAVLKDPNSRGGSVEIHEKLSEGDSIRISKQGNHFPLQDKVSTSLLFGGGIGITPIKAMAESLSAQNQNFQLYYFGRGKEQMAFYTELKALYPEQVSLILDHNTANMPSILANPQADKHLYVCGPNGFMDFIFDSAKALGWDESTLHKEHFGAEIDTNGQAFTVEARRSGRVFEVEPGQTIANRLKDEGIDVLMSCQSGVCGTCLTKVIEGSPDHRDLVQTDLEKGQNSKIAVCCSRSKSKKLVLDI